MSEQVGNKKAWATALLCAAVTILTISVRTNSAPSTVPRATVTLLANFDDLNGSQPNAMAQGVDGNLYGTTGVGGGPNSGVIFELTVGGELSALYDFCEQEGCPDGAVPQSAPILGSDGNLYGTTSGGGANESNCLHDQCGTVFRFTTGHALTTLYNFCEDYVSGTCLDGASPSAALVQGTDGNFYGTTYMGGTYNNGTVFKVTTSGALTTLHSFDLTDGAAINGSLVWGTGGNLYGTATHGGLNNDGGTAFKITPDGNLTVLYNFCSVQNCSDGEEPTGLVEGPEGNFYGATFSGGVGNAGTIFQLTPTGILTTVQYFDGTPGANPSTPLILGSDGNFYGTTTDSGANHTGPPTLFGLRPNRDLKTLFVFHYPDGLPSQLVQNTNGNFYGSTTGNSISGDPQTSRLFTNSGGLSSDIDRLADGRFYGRVDRDPRSPGGITSYGMLYELSVGLGPFVEANPAAARVGKTIGILGTNLTRATGVTFNGTSAAFKLKSATRIVATVPSGATSGKMQVVTPNGTLSSNVPFYVLH